MHIELEAVVEYDVIERESENGMGSRTISSFTGG